MKLDTLNMDRIESWRKCFNIPAGIEVRIPLPKERDQLPPSGFITVSEGCFKAGFRVPPPEEAMEIFRYCGVLMTQFTPAGIARVMGFICFFREHGSDLSLEMFRDWCDGLLGPGGRVDVRSNKRWLMFEEKTDHRHGGTFYGFVENSWILPEAWRELSDRCRRIRG